MSFMFSYFMHNACQILVQEIYFTNTFVFLAKSNEQPPEKRAKFEYAIQAKEEEGGDPLIQNEAVVINTESQNSQVRVLIMLQTCQAPVQKWDKVAVRIETVFCRMMTKY